MLSSLSCAVSFPKHGNVSRPGRTYVKPLSEKMKLHFKSRSTAIYADNYRSRAVVYPKADREKL